MRIARAGRRAERRQFGHAPARLHVTPSSRSIRSISAGAIGAPPTMIRLSDGSSPPGPLRDARPPRATRSARRRRSSRLRRRSGERGWRRRLTAGQHELAARPRAARTAGPRRWRGTSARPPAPVAPPRSPSRRLQRASVCRKLPVGVGHALGRARGARGEAQAAGAVSSKVPHCVFAARRRSAASTPEAAAPAGRLANRRSPARVRSRARARRSGARAAAGRRSRSGCAPRLNRHRRKLRSAVRRGIERMAHRAHAHDRIPVSTCAWLFQASVATRSPCATPNPASKDEMARLRSRSVA
jgi:hypothetical protein